MTEDMSLQTSAEILSIASKYIVASVIAGAIGAVSLVYSVLIYFVYGAESLPFVIFGAFFIGIAFLAIGTFLVFWGLYWMRSEGKRLRKKFGVVKEK